MPTVRFINPGDVGSGDVGTGDDGIGDVPVVFNAVVDVGDLDSQLALLFIPEQLPVDTPDNWFPLPLVLFP